MIKPLVGLVLDLPLKTVSEINRRDHWAARSERRRAQQKEVRYEWKNQSKGKPVQLPCRVVLTRIGPKELDDDNLRSAFKHVRDEVATCLGVNDSPQSPAQFEYRQHAIGEHKYRVTIEVQSL